MISTRFHEPWLPHILVKLEECRRYQSRERVSDFEDGVNQSSSFMNKLTGITAKNGYQKPNPRLRSQIKAKPKSVHQTIASTAILWGKLIPQPPQCHLLPQNAQSEDEFIEDQISCLGTAKEVITAPDLMTECLQSNPNSTQSLKGQQKLPSSLLHQCKRINAVEHL